MSQTERRLFLLQSLLHEMPEFQSVALPADTDGQRHLLRALLNVRPPQPAGEEFLRIQDAYLQAELARKGITDAADLASLQPGLSLWRAISPP